MRSDAINRHIDSIDKLVGNGGLGHALRRTGSYLETFGPLFTVRLGLCLAGGAAIGVLVGLLASRRPSERVEPNPLTESDSFGSPMAR